MTTKEKIIAVLDQLSPEQQQSLLAQAKQLLNTSITTPNWVNHAGQLSDEEAAKMIQDIEEAFERVNLDAW